MRVFAVRDEFDASKNDLAYLLYYEKDRRFYIELPDDSDPWETPLLLSSFAKSGERTIDSYWSLMWVRQRIIPEDRQNLGHILRENGLDEYDEFKLLMAGKGRCAQDDYYLEEITEESLLAKFSCRYEKRIEDVVCLDDGYILTFFRNGKVKKIDLTKLEHKNTQLARLLKYDELYKKLVVQPGGYGVCWGEKMIIKDEQLYAMGEDVPLSLNDFRSFIASRVVGTAEAMDMLSCTRQNINDLINRGKLTPVKKELKNTLFLKSDISKRNWY